MIVTNAFSTLVLSTAEVSMNGIFDTLAHLMASSWWTARECSKSRLFPTSTVAMDESVCSLISVSHLAIFSNVL